MASIKAQLVATQTPLGSLHLEFSVIAAWMTLTTISREDRQEIPDLQLALSNSTQLMLSRLLANNQPMLNSLVPSTEAGFLLPDWTLKGFDWRHLVKQFPKFFKRGTLDSGGPSSGHENLCCSHKACTSIRVSVQQLHSQPCDTKIT